jgi:lipid-binding SYLF domain-containing protein
MSYVGGIVRRKGRKAFAGGGRVLQEIMSAPDKGIPEEVIEGAKCIAVIPHEIKGGLVFGVALGKRAATCLTANGWSSPEFFSVTGGSWGAQIGLEGVDNVLMIMNQKGMDRLLTSKFQIGGEASACRRPSWPARDGGYGLEVGYGNIELFPSEGRLRWGHIKWDMGKS